MYDDPFEHQRTLTVEYDDRESSDSVGFVRRFFVGPALAIVTMVTATSAATLLVLSGIGTWSLALALAVLLAGTWGATRTLATRLGTGGDSA